MNFNNENAICFSNSEVQILMLRLNKIDPMVARSKNGLKFLNVEKEILNCCNVLMLQCCNVIPDSDGGSLIQASKSRPSGTGTFF